MFELIAITDQKQCKDFLKRLSELAQNHVPFILREKDLSREEYLELCRKVKCITDDFIIHTHIDVAQELGHKKIHLTYFDFLRCDIDDFETVGVSVHSIDEAKECQKKGASYITYSHIFPTYCKKDLPPKGLEMLKKVCSEINIAVYALGGINADNIKSVVDAGANGACVMSLLMKCENVTYEIQKLRNPSLT